MATPQQKAAAGVVVGMNALTGQTQPQPRYDIDVLLTKHPDTFNLFLQAMAKIQTDPGILGFYGMAGIHGLPSDLWDSVGREFQDAMRGYCAHGVLVFPTWHRPYLALFEQTLYLRMVDIAQGFSQKHRQRYLDAAKLFRLPYYDYFRPRDGPVTFPGLGPNGTTSFAWNFRLPDIFNEKNVTIRQAPDDTLVEIPNPLYSYKFTEKNGQLGKNDRDGISKFYNTNQTVRWPKTLNSTTHDETRLSYVLNSGREGRAEMFLALINSPIYNEVEAVASDRFLRPGVPRTREAGDITSVGLKLRAGVARGSLEGTLHGNYHNLIGGTARLGREVGFSDQVIGGHMSDPTVAAFDPVFWFHHCQIDRAWALWQIFHPDAWFPKPQKGEQPESEKGLLPFYKSKKAPGDGTYYDSDDARTTERFGYYYDDFQNNMGKDTKKLWSDLVARYDWATRKPNDPKFGNPPADMKPLPVRSGYFFQKKPFADEGSFAGFAETVTSSLMSVAEPIVAQVQAVVTPITKIDPKFDREWYVDSVVKRAAANGTFTIYFFLSKPGELTTDANDFAISPYLAGINHIFTAPREMCDNCGNQEAAGQLASDTTPITPLLLDYMKLPGSGLESLRPEHVKPFLIQHLRWRVLYRQDGVQDPRDVPDLEVGVSAKISHDDGSVSYEEYPDVVPEIFRNASATAGS